MNPHESHKLGRFSINTVHLIKLNLASGTYEHSIQMVLSNVKEDQKWFNFD